MPYCPFEASSRGGSSLILRLGNKVGAKGVLKARDGYSFGECVKEVGVTCAKDAEFGFIWQLDQGREEAVCSRLGQSYFSLAFHVKLNQEMEC